MGRSWNEAETRAKRIDRQIDKLGWSVDGIDFEAEYEVGSVGEGDHGFSDYMLPGTDDLSLTIVEAKRSSRDALAGKEQARNYVITIEAQTGCRPLVFLANGDELWYWDLINNPRRVGGFFAGKTSSVVQRLAAHGAHKCFYCRAAYQHEAIRRAHEAIEERKRRMLWVMATGTGKTRALAALISTMIKHVWLIMCSFWWIIMRLLTRPASLLVSGACLTDGTHATQ